jgi:hypothetical protein
MTPNGTYKIKELVANTSYKPVWQNLSPRLKDGNGSPASTNNAASAAVGAGSYSHPLVQKFMIAANTVTNGNFVRIWGVNNNSDEYVDIPKAAFIVGNEYNIYLDKWDIVTAAGAVVEADRAKLTVIGYLAKNLPFDYSE